MNERERPAPAESRGRGSSGAEGAGRFGEVLLLGLSLAAVGCWIVLQRWYSLPANRDNTHFAFEKIPGQFDSPILRWTVVLFLVIGLIYAAGFWVIGRARRISTLIKLGVALLVIGPAVANIVIYPVGALDVFNYMIELKLAFHYGENPYVTTFAAYRHDPFALPAFLVDVELFYGPVWLWLSGLPALLTGYDDFVQLLVALKIFNLALVVLTGVAIFQYYGSRGAERRVEESRSREAALSRSHSPTVGGGVGDGAIPSPGKHDHGSVKRGWLAAYAYVANPLVLFEGVANAHNDVMLTLLLVAGLLALRRRSGLAGPLLALSALVKFFTAVLAPLFLLVMVLRRWSWRTVALSVAGSVVLVAGTFAPYWAGGEMIDGLRRGTVVSQRMDHVSLFSLYQQHLSRRQMQEGAQSAVFSRVELSPGQHRLSDEATGSLRRIFTGIFAAAALLVLWTVRRGRAPERAVVDILLLFSLLLTNLYPWYLIPVFAVLLLHYDRLSLAYLFTATTLGLVYYPMYVYAHFNSGWTPFEVHQFLALFLTAPMVAFLLLEVGRAAVGNRGVEKWREALRVRARSPRGWLARG